MIRPFTHPGIHAEDVFITDNGRCLCGEHLGMMASATLRDLSGQAIYRVTPEDAAADPAICCETCGTKPSRLVRVA